MISNSDFEKAWFLYKTEYEPNNVSINDFCIQQLDDPRKGISYLIESLKVFWNSLVETEQDAVLIVTAGKQFLQPSNVINFDVLNFGFVPLNQMPELYAMSDVFLSSSINDAGPMMVNQSLSCGTPVVAFEMGTALDSIKNKTTGYCAKLKDTSDFAKGIEYIYRLSASEKETMSSKCRDYAINNFSYTSRINSILEIYEKYRN